MKKKLFNRLRLLPLLFAMAALIPACKKNSESGATPPMITSVRMYHPAGQDTLLSTGSKTDTSLALDAGKYVVIIGQNLKYATKIEFDGVSAPFNPALLASGSAVVQIPNIIYSTIDTTKLYTLSYETPAGSTTFSFKLGPPAPTIWSISDVFANPGDSVYLFGANLVFVQSFVYGGTKIDSFKLSVTGDSLGFLMPALTPTKLITVITKSGTALDTINAKPIITGISNDNANVGDSVYVYGNYLKTIQSLSFGGATITDFTEGPHGIYVKFLAPASGSYSSGPVTIVTSYGTVSTVYSVNTQNGVTDGLLADFEWGNNFGYGWGSNENLVSNMADFNGSMGTNTTQYMELKIPVLAAGASVFFPLGNSNTGNHWVPVENITDPPSSWALQFEMSVPQPWNGGTLYIETQFAGDSYVARYEPWEIPGSNNTVAFNTKGWETVTIPLTAFKSKVNELGDGVSITQISDLLGPTGASSYNMYLENFGTSSTATGFYAAIDNIRCVKIK